MNRFSSLVNEDVLSIKLNKKLLFLIGNILDSDRVTNFGLLTSFFLNLFPFTRGIPWFGLAIRILSLFKTDLIDLLTPKRPLELTFSVVSTFSALPSPYCLGFFFFLLNLLAKVKTLISSIDSSLIQSQMFSITLTPSPVAELG